MSDRDGEATLFVEEITGENDTLICDFKTFSKDRSMAFVDADYVEVRVPTARLDSFLRRAEVRPDFVKIDVEGAELAVLRGMEDCLENHKPKLLVEVTPDHGSVYEILIRDDYVILGESLTPIAKPRWRNGRVAEVVEIRGGGVGSDGLAKEEPTPWTKLRQPRRRRH